MPVVDASLLVTLVSGDPRRALVLQRISDWLDQRIEIHAPLLAQYEIANALTRLVVTAAFPADKIEEANNSLLVLPIQYHQIAKVSGVIEVAGFWGPAKCL